MKDAWQRLIDFFLTGLWTLDKSELSRLAAYGIAALRFIVVIMRDVLYGQLTLLAMSLVYTTLLSLVPLLAVSFSLLKAFGVHNRLEIFLYNVLAPLGPQAAEVSQRIVEFVNNMQVGILGFVGLGMLIYTVLSLIQKIEESFNSIWRVRSLRSVLQRFSDYLSVILVGPLLVVVAFGLTATLLSSSLMQRFTAFEPFGTLVTQAGRLIPYALVCASFTFIYIFVPNTKVKLSSAVIGGLVGGVLWETIGWGFASFIVTSTRYAAIYSGFAILMLFLLWLYISWLILLIGAEIAFYHQNPQLLFLRQCDLCLNSRFIEQTAMSIMFLIGANYYRNETSWDVNSLVQRLGTPIEQTENIIFLLQEKNLIVKTAGSHPAYMPARDPETISLHSIIAAVRGWEQRSNQGEENIVPIEAVANTIDALDAAIESNLGQKTLKDLVVGHADGCHGS